MGLVPQNPPCGSWAEEWCSQRLFLPTFISYTPSRRCEFVSIQKGLRLCPEAWLRSRKCLRRPQSRSANPSSDGACEDHLRNPGLLPLHLPSFRSRHPWIHSIPATLVRSGARPVPTSDRGGGSSAPSRAPARRRSTTRRWTR